MTIREYYQQVLKQQDRWIFWLPVMIGAGVVIYFSLYNEPETSFTGSAVSLAAVGAYLSFRRFKILFFIFLMLTLVSAGFMLAHFRTFMVAAPVVEEDIGFIWVRGVVESLEKRSGAYRMVLRDVSLWKQPESKNPAKIRINVRTPLNGARVGDYVSVKAKLSPPPGPVMPEAYDFSRWAFFHEIGAVGFSVVGVEVKQTAKERGTFLSSFVERIRTQVTEKILTNFTSEEAKNDRGGIAAALLTGEKGSIRKSTLESMRSAGVGHLLAISGLHLVLVTSTIFFVVRLILALIPRIVLNYNIKKWAACMALLFGFMYLLLSGAPVSAQRSFIMVSLFLLAILIDRMGSPMRPVIWAALIILLITPESVLTPSFQMSFSAAIALIAAFQWSSGLRPENTSTKTGVRKIFLYIVGLSFSSLVAGSATAPYAIYHFGHISQYGILANALAIPVTSIFIMPAGLMALILMPFGLEHIGLYIMGLGIDVVVFWASHINSLPASNVKVPTISGVALVIITIGALWLCFWRNTVRALGVPVIVLGILWAFIDRSDPDVIIDRTGKLFAVNAGDGEYIFSNRRFARYSRGIWKQMLGQGGDTVVISDSYDVSDGVQINCSDWACTYSKFDQKILIIYGDNISGEEELDYCVNLDIVVVLQGKNNPCKVSGAILPGTKIIENSDLSDKGTHSIRFLPEGLEVKTVKEERGNRPWTK